MPKTVYMISEEVLRKLPIGKFLEIEKIKNMDNKTVEAIKWNWNNPECGNVTSYFHLHTGDYIKEAV